MPRPKRYKRTAQENGKAGGRPSEIERYVQAQEATLEPPFGHRHDEDGDGTDDDEHLDAHAVIVEDVEYDSEEEADETFVELPDADDDATHGEEDSVDEVADDETLEAEAVRQTKPWAKRGTACGTYGMGDSKSTWYTKGFQLQKCAVAHAQPIEKFF